ncbi:MAG: DNA polymerase [Nitrososphaera sp.]
MTEPYFIVDLETTVYNRGEGAVGKFSASPWHPQNRIVAAGYKRGVGSVLIDYDTCGVRLPTQDEIVVGHNIKFDLQYLRRYSPAWGQWLCRGHVWDTMLAEYLLSGQSLTYPSLDLCSARYGGTAKDPLVSEYWEQGMETEDIPQEQLCEYLRHDVLNTELVYLAQRAKARELGMEALIWANMEALLATAEMEYNGMWFDARGALVKAEELAAHKKGLEEKICDILAIHLPDGVLPNASSREQLSAALFGGSFMVPTAVAVCVEDAPILYKTGPRKGEPKTRIEPRAFGTDGLGLVTKSEWVTSKSGVYQVNDGVLQALKCDTVGGNLVSAVLEYRKLEKDISTYYRGYSNLTWGDNCIHPSLEHCSTATGRLSCTRPNLQNVTGETT